MPHGASYEPVALKFHVVRSSTPGLFGFCGKPFGKSCSHRVAAADDADHLLP